MTDIIFNGAYRCKMKNICLLFFFLLATAYGSSIGRVDTDAIIELVNTGNSKWEAGHNFDPDTPLSFIKRLLGAKKYTSETVELRGENALIADSDIPEEFDAREYWSECPTIREIRDQGNCGSCWAVAAASTFTDRFCIATNGSFTLPLSDQELMSCCKLCGEGCEGGFPYVAWKYFVLYGIVTGGRYNSQVGCQPYEMEQCEHQTIGNYPNCKDLPKLKTPECHRECTNPLYNTSYENDHRKVHRVYGLRNNVTAIQKEILTHGPVMAAFEVYRDFITYKKGVYSYVTGDDIGGHAVRLIGWGVEGTTPYWLAANSWNEHWGDKGFFKILRGHNHCGIEGGILAALPVVD